MIEIQDKPIKALLVEDNPLYARTVREVLIAVEGAQFDLECVDRLATGIERLAAGGVDLVLLDLMLPDSRGFETFVTVHTQAPDLPIIVLSDLWDEELAVQTVHEGAQDYLVKGRVDSDSLARAICDAVECKPDQEGLLRSRTGSEPRAEGQTAELSAINGQLQRAIAERVRAEGTLRECERKFRSIFEQSYDGIGLIDEQGDIIEWNQSMERITGLKRDEVLGRPLWDVQFQSAPEERKSPAMYERMKQGTLEFLRTGQAVWLNRLQEVDIQCPDGTYRCIQLLIFPIKTDVGFMAGHITRDVTEQRRAEAALQKQTRALQQARDELEKRVEERTAELVAANRQLEREIAERKRAEAALQEQARALRESRERYRAIFEHAAGSIVLVDTETREVVEFNDRAHESLGYTREEFAQLQLSDLEVRESAEQGVEREEKIRQEGTHTFEVKYRTKSGEIRDAVVNVRIISIGGKNLAQGIWHDVTERRRVEEMLRQRNRELTLLNRAGHAFSSSLDLDHVLSTVLDEMRHLLDVTACSIWLIDPETGELACRQATGAQSDVVRGWRLALDEGLVGWTARTGQGLIVPDVQADERYFRGVDERTRLPLRSILSVPLRVKEMTIGVLQAVDADVNRFSAKDLELLEPLAASAAIAIENAQLYEETKNLRAFNENIVQSMEEGIILDDPTGHIIFVNSMMAELLGYPPEELIGRHWTTLVAPEYLAQVEEETSKRPQGIASRYEAVLLNREGQRVPVIVSARPMFDQDQFTGVLAVFTDITERKRAEVEIKRRNEELITLNTIATALSQPLNLHYALDVTLDRTLEVIGGEAGWIQLLDGEAGVLVLAAHQGFSQEVVVEVKAIELGHRLIQSGEPASVGRLLYNSRIGVESIKREGLHTLASIPITSKNQVLGVLSIFGRSSVDLPNVDPRELSVQELQLLTAIAHQIGVAIENARLVEEVSEVEILRELNRLRSELVANVSHELRTPLGLIKFFVTSLLMEDADFDRETELRFLREIDEETDRLEIIVDNLLDMSRVESGRLRLDRQPTNITRLAKEVIASTNVELEIEAHLAQHHLTHDFPSESLVALVDARRIEQVLRNLLYNAVKYSPDGGTITVHGRGDKDQILIWVSDQGVGIPPQDLGQIFERFYRVDNAVTQKSRGAGLGLSVCQGIVEAHGGRIWAESVLGKGSSFYFTLPLTADEPLRDLVSDQGVTDEEG